MRQYAQFSARRGGETESNALDPGSLTAGAPVRAKGFEETVRDYLVRELTNHPDDLRGAVLARAEALMREVQA